MIEQAVTDQDQRDGGELMAGSENGRIHFEDADKDEIAEQQPHTHVHRGDDEEKTQDVEPGSDPAPAASTEHGCPVVQAAGRWVCGSDLSHRQRDDDGDRAANQPAYPHPRAARGAKSERKSGDAPRQNTDDRKRNGEIGEPTHSPGKLLRIPHFMQMTLIVLFHIISHVRNSPL